MWKTAGGKWEYTELMYAAAISRDGDDLDGERTVHQIKEWILATNYIKIDESSERHELFHITTSDTVFEEMGYRQLDIFR